MCSKSNIHAQHLNLHVLAASAIPVHNVNTHGIQESNTEVLDDAVQCHKFKHTEGSY